MAHDTSTLPAQKRDQSGKGPARRLRAKGLVPAICYGPFDKEPLRVAVDPEALTNAIATPHKFNTVITLQVDGGETRTVLFKSFEKDPVDGHVLHADFLEVRMDQDVVVNVPVVLTGKPVGVTEGGILQQVSRAFPLYTLHDPEHSYRVAQNMARIIPESTLESLNSIELSILIYAAYFHLKG